MNPIKVFFVAYVEAQFGWPAPNWPTPAPTLKTTTVSTTTVNEAEGLSILEMIYYRHCEVLFYFS